MWNCHTIRGPRTEGGRGGGVPSDFILGPAKSLPESRIFIFRIGRIGPAVGARTAEPAAAGATADAAAAASAAGASTAATAPSVAEGHGDPAARGRRRVGPPSAATARAAATMACHCRSGRGRASAPATAATKAATATAATKAATATTTTKAAPARLLLLRPAGAVPLALAPPRIIVCVHNGIQMHAAHISLANS